MIAMIRLNSSALTGCSYDEDTETLTIMFAGGEMVEHDDVPKEIYEGLLAAERPGQYYYTKIKGRY